MRLRATPPLPPTPSSAPHTLYDEFTFKKPAYYVLRGKRSAPYPNWTELYADVCETLAQLNPAKAATLPRDSHYTTVQGNRRFAESGAEFIRSRKIADGVYANVNLSANALRDLMRQLLPDFGLKVEDMVVYFAEV